MILKFVRTVLIKIGNAFNKLGLMIYQEPQEKRVVRWIKDNGDKSHRLNYDLSKNSLVLDLGGYEGQWASDIFSMYCCKIMIFEPVIEYAENIKHRFKLNTDIIVYNFGLSNSTRQERLSINSDGSSIYKQGEKFCNISLIKAYDFFNENKVRYIDLMKINIEGGEYDLLEHLLDNNFIVSINNIQVQFHDFVPDAESRMKKIQNRLGLTHYLTYQYPFVWDNWALKKKG